MISQSEIGQVVWHDLLTNRVEDAKRFYRTLLGWEYVVEHAQDFAWRPGEAADYPLIFLGGEAHGGFVDPGDRIDSHWLSWVMVADVDEVTAVAEELGGRIARPPFDVPGVGRGSVVEDPQGALICPFVRSHDFPAPSGVFVAIELVTPELEASRAFYHRLFGWEAEPNGVHGYGSDTNACTMQGGGPVRVTLRQADAPDKATWTAYLSTDDVEAVTERAKELGAHSAAEPRHDAAFGPMVRLTDPVGAIFGLCGVSGPTV